MKARGQLHDVFHALAKTLADSSLDEIDEEWFDANNNERTNYALRLIGRVGERKVMLAYEPYPPPFGQGRLDLTVFEKRVTPDWIVIKSGFFSRLFSGRKRVPFTGETLNETLLLKSLGSAEAAGRLGQDGALAELLQTLDADGFVHLAPDDGIGTVIRYSVNKALQVEPSWFLKHLAIARRAADVLFPAPTSSPGG